MISDVRVRGGHCLAQKLTPLCYGSDPSPHGALACPPSSLRLRAQLPGLTAMAGPSRLLLPAPCQGQTVFPAKDTDFSPRDPERDDIWSQGL